MSLGLAVGLPQDADEHRPECSILLAVDQELGPTPPVAVRHGFPAPTGRSASCPNG